MKPARATLMLCAGFLCIAALGQKKSEPKTPHFKGSSDQASFDQPSLNQITDRGRALYEYDQAAWHGTDAFLALHPDTDRLAHYVCQKTAAGWVVDFGKFNEAHDKFFVVYEATDAGHPGEFTARKLDPAREESGFIFAAERAVETAFSVFETPMRPYNTAVLPAPGGNLYVYLYPGQTKSTVWPLGGDVRYMISPDGQKILETRQMHKTILDREDTAGSAGGYHIHVLSSIPEDTDVFYVLNHRPSVPEYVGANDKVFVIATDGSITIAKK